MRNRTVLILDLNIEVVALKQRRRKVDDVRRFTRRQPVLFIVFGNPRLERTAALVFPGARPAQVLCIVLLGIPPSVFFGMAGSLLTATIRTLPFGKPIEGDGSSERSAVRDQLLLRILILSAIGYLSPMAIVLRPNPRLVVDIAPVLATPAPTRIAPPTLPKWRYEKPSDFDGLDAAHVGVSTVRTLGTVQTDFACEISPDGRYLAYFAADSDRMLCVRDLETLDTISSCNAPADSGSFAWSPDSKMLLVAAGSRERSLRVLKVETNRTLALPQPTFFAD